MAAMPLSGRTRKVSSDTWFAGIDGCRAGWLLAFVRAGDGEVRLRVVSRFAEVIAAPEALIAVDIPIGLPEQAGHGGRRADNMVRPLLGARKSSVFSVPSRRAVFAEVFAFGIFSKIREVDAVLQSDRSLDGRVREAHPELAFRRFNGERPLASPKKTEAGLALRRRLLIEAGLPAVVVNGAPPEGAARDDLLDVLACVAIAWRIHRGLAQPFPDPPERDARGLPMAIWA